MTLIILITTWFLGALRMAAYQEANLNAGRGKAALWEVLVGVLLWPVWAIVLLFHPELKKYRNEFFLGWSHG